MKEAAGSGGSPEDPALFSELKRKSLLRPQDFSCYRSSKSPSNSPLEIFTRVGLFACALVSVLTTAAIVIFLFHEVWGFFDVVKLTDFLFGLEWAPLIGEIRSYGVLPLVGGTLMVALGACAVAIPIGLACALYLSEYAPKKLGTVLKSLLEVLAGIPTVVYGFLAITFVTPALQDVFSDVQVFNALSASIVVGVMIIPTISSISQDAFESVPRHIREAAYGIGARKYQVAGRIVMPAALSGVVASIILAFSRALGETMAVTLAAGATPNLTLNYFESVQTMTSYIVQVSKGDTPTGTIEYKTIFAVGILLFLMTLVTNVVAQFFVKRVQEKY